MKGNILVTCQLPDVVQETADTISHPLFLAPTVVGKLGPMEWIPNEHLLMAPCVPPHELCAFDVNVVNYSKLFGDLVSWSYY